MVARAHLRRAGGSTIVTVPAKVLEDAGLSASSVVDVEYDPAAKAVIMRQAKPRYTLAELLAQCNPDASLTDEDLAWLGDAPAGGEAI